MQDEKKGSEKKGGDKGGKPAGDKGGKPAGDKGGKPAGDKAAEKPKADAKPQDAKGGKVDKPAKDEKAAPAAKADKAAAAPAAGKEEKAAKPAAGAIDTKRLNEFFATHSHVDGCVFTRRLAAALTMVQQLVALIGRPRALRAPGCRRRQGER